MNVLNALQSIDLKNPSPADMALVMAHLPSLLASASSLADAMPGITAYAQGIGNENYRSMWTNQIGKYQEALVPLLEEAQAQPAQPDWKQMACDLHGALDQCVTQVEQMKGLFDDDDGLIQQSLDDADEVMTTFQVALKGDRHAV